jgi:hypothetical protein
MSEEDLKKADLNWCLDILRKIDDILKKPNLTTADINGVHWLVKQGLKVERE